MKILFVGGAHGVGKSTLCEAAAAAGYDMAYRSASSFIREAKPAAIPTKGKYVADLDANQRLLIDGVDQLRPMIPVLLLDGHYVIGVRGEGIKPVPLSVFQALDVASLAHVHGEATAVFEQLRARDGEMRSVEETRRFLELDLHHARTVAAALNLPLEEIRAGDSMHFHRWLTAAGVGLGSPGTNR